MPYITDIILRQIGRAISPVRDWLFSATSEAPPDMAAVTVMVEEFVAMMHLGEGPQRLNEWLDEHAADLVATPIGVYRVD